MDLRFYEYIKKLIVYNWDLRYRINQIFQENLMQVTPAPEIATIAVGFQALSDSLRIKILELLRSQELCVCELCEQLDISQSKLSFHLKTLREAGLVRSRQQGRWIYYSLNLPQIVAIEQYLAEYRRFTSVLPARPCSDTPKYTK